MQHDQRHRSHKGHADQDPNDQRVQSEVALDDCAAVAALQFAKQVRLETVAL
jgi:hypothetical protein